ncbi:MAG: metal-dependent hydrolase [Chitinophagales bacterium]|nr:metal-dependent hydrolase [Chitinophagales bacterium]
MKLTYYGHACFALEIKGKHLLFDPFITPNELAKDIDIKKIKADYIFISHGHEDHVADALSIANNTGATVVANFEIYSWFMAKGVKNGHPMNHGGVWEFDFGQVKMVNAVHSSVLPDGTYGGNPAGYVFTTDEGNFYFAGDTALTMDMKLIPMTCSDVGFCILPIGNNFTMGVNDAIIAADFVGCDTVIGVHYDTFGYIKIDKEEAKQAFAKNGKELILLEIGETRDI